MNTDTKSSAVLCTLITLLSIGFCAGFVGGWSLAPRNVTVVSPIREPSIQTVPLDQITPTSIRRMT